MSARILVVDDVPSNVKLLEARLSAEYFDVVTAASGTEALVRAKEDKPDLILLDVRMPDLDGFEVCRRLKADPALHYVPVVMVTALDQPSDKLFGLEAGADDFLTKPINDFALLARVRNLIRIKTLIDELHMREATGVELGVVGPPDPMDEIGRARILIVEDDETELPRILKGLSAHDVERATDPCLALDRVKSGSFDLALVSATSPSFDGLRLCSQLRSQSETRHLPLVIMVDEADQKRLSRALDLGVNDYLTRPVDGLELQARISTQLRRRRFAARLRETLNLSLELAVTDSLTGLFNRRYMVSHLSSLLRRGIAESRPLSVLFIDIDHFKSVNDTAGHAIGDIVLRETALRIAGGIRGVDLACRYGGEEFFVIMPDTDLPGAMRVAERIRRNIAEEPIHADGGHYSVTVSIGVTTSKPQDMPETLVKRADKALYRAKHEGRNRVISEAI